MMRRNLRISLIARLATLPLVLALCVVASAQDDPSIVESVATKKTLAGAPDWHVFITFNKSFVAANEAKISVTSHYSLFHAVSKTLIPLTSAKLATTSSGKKIFSMVDLQVEPLVEGDFYQLFVHGIDFGDDALEKPLVSTLTFTHIDDDEGPATKLAVTAADDREESNIYLAGEVTRGSGTEFNGSADIKLSYPLTSDFWNRSQFFELFYDLKASTDPEADPDTMKFGVDWAFLARKRNGSNAFFAPIWFKNSFLVEAERDFDNANLTWSPRFVAPSRVLRNENKTVRFYVRPFIGFEFGKNINSPVKEAENKALARGLFGSTAVLAFPLKRQNLSGILLEASYVRRLLMRPEVYFDKAEDGKLGPVFFGRNPRDWIEGKLSFNFSDAFGFYVGYQYGQQPPSYKLVDHQMKIGLIYKVKFKKPEE